MIDATEIESLLGAFLARQRWFAAGSGSGAPVRVTEMEVIRQEWPALLWAAVEMGGSSYQVPIGLRPGPEVPERLAGHESALLGAVSTDQGAAVAYDAVADNELATVILGLATGGARTAELVRAVGAEQSNSSLVFDERLIMKLYRRLHRGNNPDVEVTTALDEAGFNHIAAPVGVWRRGDVDVAFVQDFLAGGTEGWALALTSLRDLFASGGPPESAGGDFAPESSRLGEMTARMHLALARAFGARAGDPVLWADRAAAELARAEQMGPGAVSGELVAIRELLGSLRGATSAGAAIRVHGDYHLGQVMRTDVAWFVLDFEGEPSAPIEQRRQFASPIKDVAGMLRSLEYVALSAASERDTAEREAAVVRAGAWQERNRHAFLEGYMSTPQIDTLLPGTGDLARVLLAHEAEKAAYELRYELEHRPGWVHIPEHALRRLARQGS
ncbi:MAG: maltokinase N-terminal cap-like domain-containing protein [Acidimicrobiales bacterium]